MLVSHQPQRDDPARRAATSESEAGRRPAFLSTAIASDGERSLAFAVMLFSTIIFVAAAPFARVPLAPLWAFIPIYQSALALNDLVTAVLLFAQFRVLRSRALLVLACGYLFTTGMVGVHLLSFPGLFSPIGLLGAGPQTTAWLYMYWHGGFPLFVIAYAWLKHDMRDPGLPAPHVGTTLFVGILGVAAAVVGLVSARNDRPCAAARDHAGQRLYVCNDRGGFDGVVAERHRAPRAVDAAPPLHARRLADGGDVCLDLRYRAERGPQRRTLRPRLLCRPHLWSAGRDFRPGRAALPNRRAQFPARAAARCGAGRTPARKRAAPAHLRDFARSDPHYRPAGPFPPGQPERDDHPRLRAVGNDRPPRDRLRPSR